MERAPTVPPSRFGPRGTDWKAVCAEVDTLKGDWGKVGKYHPSVVTRIKSGDYPSVDPAMYEVTSRKDGDSSWLWMRRKQKGEK